MIDAPEKPGILERLFDSGTEELPREVAKFFLNLKFTDADHRRIASLSEKANEGELSNSERDELFTYVLLNDFLIIMQSRARRSLQSNSPRA